MAKYWDPPPFSPKIFFNQNDSEWPEMDFKHNFKNCNILSAGPPEGFPKGLMNLSISVNAKHLQTR